MELFPAIDLREGRAVRLTQGDFERQQAYGDPIDLARSYMAAGARWIHVVDLDAARTGVPHQRDVIGEITLRALTHGVRVQCGGGVRTEADLEALIEIGVDRVVLGTAALEMPELAAQWARSWPDRVAVGLDYVIDDQGRAEALGHGWKAGAARFMQPLLDGWVDDPIAAVVATSIKRDGMLRGPDVVGLRSLLGQTAFPVVASGGVGDLEDLRTLAALNVGGRRLEGAIVGKAIVEKRFSVEEGIAACGASA